MPQEDKPIDLRDEVYTRINLKKTLAEYVINDFTLEKTYYPGGGNFSVEELNELHPNGKVYVIAMVPGDFLNLSRNNFGKNEFSVQIGLQRFIEDFSDIDLQDNLFRLLLQFLDTCVNDVDLAEFSFDRLEFLKDPDQTPYSFIGLRDASVWEAYFTAVYTTTLR